MGKFIGAMLLVMGELSSTPAAWATNQDFQNFFFTACMNPSGVLAARCAETTAGLGDISGDSESSLNPSQILSNGDTGLAAARSRSKEARERTERLRGGEGGGGGSQIDIGPFSLLINARGRYDESDRRVDVEAERGYEMDSWGLELGFDYRVNNDAVIGALISWENAEIEFDNENPGTNFTPAPEGAGEIEQDGIAFTLFGSVNVSDNSYLEASVGYTTSDYDLSRNVVFQESGRVVPQTNVRVSADTDATTTWAAVNWGYLAERGGWTFSPYAGFTYSNSEVDGYRETDLSASGLAMIVNDVERSSLAGHLGLRISAGISTTNAVLIPHFRIEYEHEFDRDAETSSASFQLDASANQFSFSGDDPDRNFFNIGLGVAAIMPNGWIPFFDYQLLVGHDTLDSYRISVGLRKEL